MASQMYENGSVEPFTFKTSIFLPRQARDKHIGKALKKAATVFSTGLMGLMALVRNDLPPCLLSFLMTKRSFGKAILPRRARAKHIREKVENGPFCAARGFVELAAWQRALAEPPMARGYDAGVVAK